MAYLLEYKEQVREEIMKHDRQLFLQVLMVLHLLLLVVLFLYSYANGGFLSLIASGFLSIVFVNSPFLAINGGGFLPSFIINTGLVSAVCGSILR